MQPSAQLETISPDTAMRLLSNNKHNRPINEVNLNGIIHDMKRDNFHLTGESIKVSKSGMLLDGQHRLMAITKTGKTAKMFVMRGLDDEAFKYIDTGRTRKASDVLGIEGVANPARISAIVKFIINFKNGAYSNMAQNKLRNRGSKSIITNADVSKFVAQNSDSINESIPYGFCKENKLLSGALLASLHYIFKGINAEDAEKFCWGLASGESISKSSPIYLLRNKLLQDIRSTRKMGRLERIGVICKAWNAYRKKQVLQVLRWDSIKEPFPKPI